MITESQNPFFKLTNKKKSIVDPKNAYFRVLTVPGLSRQLPVCKSPKKVSDFFLHHPIELARSAEMHEKSWLKVPEKEEFCLFKFINLCLSAFW